MCRSCWSACIKCSGARCETAYRHHIDDTCPVTDAPTIRIMKQILVDYEPMLAWADAAINAYIDGGVDESRLEQWRWHLVAPAGQHRRRQRRATRALNAAHAHR